MRTKKHIQKTPATKLKTKLKQTTHSVLAIGQTVAELDAKGLDWASVDVLLNCGVGAAAGKRDDIRVGVFGCGLVG